MRSAEEKPDQSPFELERVKTTKLRRSKMKSLPILLVFAALSAAVAESYQPIEITVETSKPQGETGMGDILVKNRNVPKKGASIYDVRTKNSD